MLTSTSVAYAQVGIYVQSSARCLVDTAHTSGILLAEDSLYLTVTALLATVDIAPFDAKRPATLEFTEGAVK